MTFVLLRTWGPLLWSRRRGALPLWRLLFCLRVVPVDPGLVTCHTVLKKPHVFTWTLKQITGDCLTLLTLVICSQTRHKIRTHTRFMCRSSVQIPSREPTEIPQSSAISRTVSLLLLRTIVLTLAIISSFLNVDWRPEPGSPSTEVLPPLTSPPVYSPHTWNITVYSFFFIYQPEDGQWKGLKHVVVLDVINAGVAFNGGSTTSYLPPCIQPT